MGGKFPWGQWRRVNELGDTATMAVNEMGDPIYMEDEEEPEADERPIKEEELNAIVSALSETRLAEVAYVDAHLVGSGWRVRVLVDSSNLV